MFAAVIVALALFGEVAAAPLGEPVEISGPECRFPDAAFNSVRGEYLVVWADYTAGERGVFGRRVTRDGEMAGEVFRISPRAEKEAFFPAIIHCAGDCPNFAQSAEQNGTVPLACIDEYLVTFDTSNGIQGQRVRGDGTLAGESFAISTTPGIRSAVAWSEKNRCALVVYYMPGRGGAEVFARRVRLSSETSSGFELLSAEVNLSRDAPYSGYPAVAYAADGDQFLVTWDHEPKENHGYIRGQRISAGTGKMLGESFDIATSGTDNRSTIAYDSGRNRWLVQYNSARTRGNSYDQYGRFVAVDGTLGEEIAIATSAAFEGDTLFGGDIAFVSGHGGRFFSSFARDGGGMEGGMAGQQLSADGARLGGQVMLGTGPYTCLNNAADSRLNRVLTVWEGREGNTHIIRGRVFRCEAAK
jgi:hypothetical protein